MYQTILGYGGKGVLSIESLADRIFTPRYNPFYYLGAIAIFCMWLLVITGVYLFIFYEIAAPHESIKYITEEQWHIGGIIRGIHRYAADGVVIATILHLLHVYLTDRYRRWRWVAWVSGIFFLAAVWITGIIGYWMVWDERSQIIAEVTAKILDYIPIFGDSLSLSFTTNSLITSLFFFMALFVHLTVPVGLFIILWIHVIRITRPVINPPKMIAAIIICILIALAAIKPAISLPPADTNKIMSIVKLDWFFLFFYPALNSLPIGLSWVIMAAVAFILTMVPWFIRSEKPATAGIAIDLCTGCAQCFKDCPYEAIHMRPRTDGKPYDIEAVVIPKRCASCGICVGSCDFNAVTLPHKTEKQIMDQISGMVFNIKNNKGPKLIGMLCSYSTTLAQLIDASTSTVKNMPNVGIITIPCAGMIHHSWVEHGLQSGADGIFICGCQHGDCYFRFGNTWLEERVTGKRPPVFRQTIDRSRLRIYWHSALHTGRLWDDIKTFERDIKAKTRREYMPEKVSMGKLRLALASLVLAIPAVLIFSLSDAGSIFFNPHDSLLKLSIKHTGKRIVECDELGLLEQEAKKYEKQLKETKKAKMDLTALGKCSRERNPISIEVSLDNEKKLMKSYKPGGWKRDGASFVYEKFILKPGRHAVLIKMRDSKVHGKFDYIFEDSLEFKSGYVIVIDFDERKGGFFIR